MSKSAPSGRAKRSRVHRATPRAPPNAATDPHADRRTAISAEQRRAMIAERAYFRAAERGFRWR